MSTGENINGKNANGKKCKCNPQTSAQKQEQQAHQDKTNLKYVHDRPLLVQFVCFAANKSGFAASQKVNKRFEQGNGEDNKSESHGGLRDP